MLIYENNVPPDIRAAFVEKVRTIAGQLGIEPDWLMGVMWVESRLRPDARNATSKATGLIQFMPDTAVSLGTTIDALRSMDALAQLDYVLKYLKPYKGRMNSFVDTYFAIFFPAAIGKPDDWTLHSASMSAAIIAAQNNIYDRNRDGAITVGEVKASLPAMDTEKKK
ncbi:MAG: lytic transglycosylase domain-containing protein [Prevotellaceae bacterium]|nr:lytic transglycosylase domain-containing protein [Prevotellaceae bacterium]